MRNLFAETRIDQSRLILPLFVQDGIKSMLPIPSMPRQYRYAVRELPGLASEIEEAGIGAVMLFGIPSHKDRLGSGAYANDGIIQRAIGKIKDSSSLVVISDLCMCEYTDSGHCGIIRNGDVHNDLTLEAYRKIAVSQAEAGADMIAPSGMMDGQVAAIRDSLDKSGYANTPIMAYSAKMSSSFYGPFRLAADSTPRSGNRKSYQMDYANSNEAIREIAMDVEEGADVVMVKPALTNLDIISRARARFDLPLAAYNVSGEYSAINAAAERGWIDYQKAATEVLTSVFRAGADMVITYHALEFVKWRNE